MASRSGGQGKRSVRRLFVRDPYNKNSQLGSGFGNNPTVATFTPEFEQFTNNTNVAYDPSKAPGTVQVKQRSAKPVGADKGHQKVLKPNRFTLFGGKTLRRR
jgi:hypothetical protein